MNWSKWLTLQPLAGNRTYLAAAGFLLLAVSLALSGQIQEAGGAALAALAAVGIRGAISPTTPPPTAPAVLAVLLGCSGLATAAPQIGGEKAYPAHSLVRLRAEGLDAKSAVLWRVTPSKNVQRASTPRQLLEFAAPPGTYEILLLSITSGPDGLDVQETTAEVTIGGNSPSTPPSTPPSNAKPDPTKAISRISFPVQGGTAGCTAVAIGPRRSDGRWDILTAAHCMPGVGSRGKMILQDGRELAVRVTVHHKENDIAWLETEQAVEQMPFALLASKNPPVGTKVWHAGYGVDKPGNREEGEVEADEDDEGKLRFNLSVSSGDSGGPIIRADTGEVVAPVCCTLGRGVKTSMWAGSAERAGKLRPKSNAQDQWTPLEIPMCRK
jgi:hypothetical protein